MRRRWCAALGFEPEHLVTLGQIHGRDVHVATKAHAGHGARPGSTQIGLGDALVTNQIGPVLMTLHADCQPVLVVDPGAGRRGPAVGVAHAGWRGTVADIVGATLAVMTAALAHGSTMSTSSRSSYWSLLRRGRGSSRPGARQLELTPMRLSRRTIGPSQDPSGAGLLRHRFSLTAANAFS